MLILLVNVVWLDGHVRIITTASLSVVIYSLGWATLPATMLEIMFSCRDD